jgi:hypothetical protein
MYDAWEKGAKMPLLRSIRVDQTKDCVRLSSWYRGVEQGAVLTDNGIDPGEVFAFTYKINDRANSESLASLCLGVSLRPPVLRYDTAGSTLICIKAKSQKCVGPDFYVFGESMRQAAADKDGSLGAIPFEIGPGDRVTFKLNRTNDPEGLHLGSLKVQCNGSPECTLIHNLASAGLKKDEVLYPMAYASRPPVEVESVAKLISISPCVAYVTLKDQPLTGYRKVINFWSSNTPDTPKAILNVVEEWENVQKGRPPLWDIVEVDDGGKTERIPRDQVDSLEEKTIDDWREIGVHLDD